MKTIIEDKEYLKCKICPSCKLHVAQNYYPWQICFKKSEENNNYVYKNGEENVHCLTITSK